MTETHAFDSHSNRPWECRHCKGERGAAWHADAPTETQGDEVPCGFCTATFPTFDAMVAHEARTH